MSEHARPDRSAPPRLTSYDDECASYTVEVPERFNPVIDIIERWASEAPDDLALISLGPSGETVAEHTVGQLAAESRRAARALIELGVRPGDPVFIMLPRVPAWYAAMLGAIRIGAVAMPGPNQLTSRDIAYRIRSADAVAAITDEIGAPKLDAITEELPSLRQRVAWTAGRGAGGGSSAPPPAGGGAGAARGPPPPRDAPPLLFSPSGRGGYGKRAPPPPPSGPAPPPPARFGPARRGGDRH